MFVKLIENVRVEGGGGFPTMTYLRGQTFMARPSGGGFLVRTPESGSFDLELKGSECQVIGGSK